MKATGVRTALLLACSLFLGACPGEILETVPIAGYAQIQGTALRADGSRFASIFVNCGANTPNESAGSRSTDNTGAFNYTQSVIGNELPGDETLVCVFRAPADAPTLVADTLVVTFKRERAERVTTAVTLQEE